MVYNWYASWCKKQLERMDRYYRFIFIKLVIVLKLCFHLGVVLPEDQIETTSWLHGETVKADGQWSSHHFIKVSWRSVFFEQSLPSRGRVGIVRVELRLCCSLSSQRRGKYSFLWMAKVLEGDHSVNNQNNIEPWRFLLLTSSSFPVFEHLSSSPQFPLLLIAIST
jgi:hypothetical protein